MPIEIAIEQAKLLISYHNEPFVVIQDDDWKDDNRFFPILKAESKGCKIVWPIL